MMTTVKLFDTIHSIVYIGHICTVNLIEIFCLLLNLVEKEFFRRTMLCLDGNLNQSYVIHRKETKGLTSLSSLQKEIQDHMI